MKNFVAIDFETATFSRASACAVGIITVQNSAVVDEYYTLIQPPNNQYSPKCIDVHGIHPNDTKDALTFPDVFPEIQKRIQHQTIVAHNEGFDRSVLKACIQKYSTEHQGISLTSPWKCTLKLYRAKGELVWKNWTGC